LIPKAVALVRKNLNKIIPLLPLMAFAVPLLWLYLLHPESFELMWKGRTFQLFFVWLILLELILGWESLQKNRISRLKSIRTAFLILTLLLPTVYVAVSSIGGLAPAIADSAKQSGVYWWSDMPVAIEYLAFAALFCLASLVLFGTKGLKDFSVPILFTALVGAIFVVDSVYPYGQFTPFQLLVPTTTTLAANTLGLMGYNASLDLTHGSLPYLTVTDPNNSLKTASFAVAWPCAGIESLLLFSVTILLFLKRMPISWRAKVGYFAVGAAVTYFINVLRIVSIFLFAINGGDANLFHSVYGPLYPVTWIVSYPLIILGSQSLWRKIAHRNRKDFTAMSEETPANPKTESSG
jgi:thaumarchaeosortase